MLLNLLQYQLPMNILVGLLVIHLFCVVISLTAHEFAHGFMASKLGDPTAGFQGRLTLNPMAHIDPVGFIMMLLFGFGWAKPVPVNPRLMGKPKRDMALTSLAGPAINICLALVSGIAVGAMVSFDVPLLLHPESIALVAQFDQLTPAIVICYFLCLFCLLNLGLALFNLIPLPPLDGSNILVALLPNNVAARYLQVRYYTQYIFIGIMALSFLASRMPGTIIDTIDTIIWWPLQEFRILLAEWFMELGYQLFSLFA